QGQLPPRQPGCLLAHARIISVPFPTMLPEVQNLIELQQADREILRLKEEIAALPKRVAAIEQKLAGTKAGLEAAKAAIKTDEAARRKYEVAIQIGRASCRERA